MSIRKHNEFLDQGNSEDESAGGYHSDDVEEGRGAIGGRAAKRRRVEDQDQDSGGSDGEETDVAALPEKVADKRFDPSAFDEDDLDGEAPDQLGDEEDDPAVPLVNSSAKSSVPKSVERAEKAAKRSGVIYISRVPPFMRPHTLKHFLEPHAPKGIGRIFLTPEDHAAYLQRKKSGGNKKKSFTDGWVEFTSKKEAKNAASFLNGNIIGGKKGGYYHDDLWNMKYLHGFKWSHLTEQIAAENAEREARMREEIRRTRKENKAFLDDIERGKMLEGMESKRKAKKGASNGNVEASERKAPKRPGMEFKQAEVQGKGKRSKEADQPEVKRALSMIF